MIESKNSKRAGIKRVSRPAVTYFPQMWWMITREFRPGGQARKAWS